MEFHACETACSSHAHGSNRISTVRGHSSSGLEGVRASRRGAERRTAASDDRNGLRALGVCLPDFSSNSSWVEYEVGVQDE